MGMRGMLGAKHVPHTGISSMRGGAPGHVNPGKLGGVDQEALDRLPHYPTVGMVGLIFEAGVNGSLSARMVNDEEPRRESR